jgi:hypothetical protein
VNNFGEFLHLAGAAAANSDSSVHRAIACRDIDALGQAWTGALPTCKAELAGAIVATVHALAAAPSPEHRRLIASALRDLIGAARTPMPRPAGMPRHEPRRYWIEADQ